MNKNRLRSILADYKNDVASLEETVSLVVKNFTSTNTASDAIALLEDLQHVICSGEIRDQGIHRAYMKRINAVIAQQHT